MIPGGCPPLLVCMVLVSLARPGVAGLADLANTARLESCGEASAGLGRLHPEPRLDEAARRLADGRSLEAATSGAGYRARASASIHVGTREGEAGIAKVLRRRFCAILTDREFRDIGVFQRGDDTWLVLAGPLIPGEPAEALDQRVLELVNEARRQPRRCGRERFAATTPLASDPALRRAAQAHARDMASRGRLGHRGAAGSLPADRATRAGYAWQVVAENVAAGQPSAEDVVATWLSSPGHCRNLMNSGYRETGIAHAVNTEADEGIYWVQVFATPE